MAIIAFTATIMKAAELIRFAFASDDHSGKNTISKNDKTELPKKVSGQATFDPSGAISAHVIGLRFAFSLNNTGSTVKSDFTSIFFGILKHCCFLTVRFCA